jgi:predicted dehydrogenase
MPSPIRLGIVGAGAVTQVAHLPVLSRFPEVTVAALADRDLPKAAAVARRHGIRAAFDDIQAMLEAVELDALLIGTPNHLHEVHVLEALGAGLHVLVEKPIATSAAGAQRILKAAAAARRTVLVGMSHRYRHDVATVRGFVQRGELGEVESVQAVWHTFRPSRGPDNWRLRRAEAGGGAMLDLGLSALDMGLWLAGGPTPVRVSATLDRPLGARGVEQAGCAFVTCDNGATILVDVTWRHIGPGERLEVALRSAKGSAGVNPLRVWKDVRGTPTDVAPTGAGARENAFTAAVRAEWAHFAAAVRGKAPAPPLEEQVTLHRVLEAIYRAAAEGCEVTL